VTEFGRSLIAKSGFFASNVEFVKGFSFSTCLLARLTLVFICVVETGGRRIAVQYAGADSCVRTVYHPDSWPLRLSVVRGNVPIVLESTTKATLALSDKAEEVTVQSANAVFAETDIAGPCCIQADIVAHRRLLPPLLRGDTILVHDVGGMSAAPSFSVFRSLF